MKDEKLRRVLRGLRNFLVFFLTVSFLVTCCTALFVTVLANTLEIELTNETIELAAKLTFVNVIFITLIVTVIDSIRRRLTVDLPVRRITEAAEKVIAGDFQTRIKPIPRFGTDDKFNEVIACFNQLTEELSGVETLRTDFISNVSHEMKTPLAVIQNYGTLLRSPDLPEERRMEYAEAITTASRRLADMMTNILKLNRLENQQIYPGSEQLDLGEQLCSCLLDYESVWESRGINIETDIAEGVIVEADGELLALVWNNLFSNAFKFTEAGGTVRVALTTTDTHATVRVEDTGCGMSPEVGAHIFEKFYQGDTSRATQGNGLGLALVRRVVDILHAEIRVESAVGVGTAFTVVIGRRKDGEI